MVDLCNSIDNFLSNRTTTSAEKIDNETLVSSMLKGLMTSSLAAGRIVSKRCELAEKDVNKEEKKLLAPVDFMVLDTGALRGFSEPEEYTHRITSASMCSAIQLKMSVARSIEQGEDLRVDLTLLTDMNPKGLKF